MLSTWGNPLPLADSLRSLLIIHSRAVPGLGPAMLLLPRLPLSPGANLVGTTMSESSAWVNQGGTGWVRDRRGSLGTLG